MSVKQRGFADVIATRLVDPEDLSALGVKPARAHKFVDRTPGRKVGLSWSMGSGQNAPALSSLSTFSNIRRSAILMKLRV
jgi:hypothetical protein